MNNETHPPSLPAVPDTKEEDDDSLVTLRKLVEAVRRYHNNGYWPGVMDLLRHSEKAIEVLVLEKKETGGRATWECGCGTTNGVNLAACGVCNRPRGEGEVPWKKAKTLEEPGAVAANTVNGQNELLGGISDLVQPDYHALNVHCGRNDRLLHATLCAYAKWHLDNPDIGSDQLSDILQNAICEAVGDEAFCEWIDKMKQE